MRWRSAPTLWGLVARVRVAPAPDPLAPPPRAAAPPDVLKDLIQDALKTTRGNRAKAARLLDTTERVLNYKVRKYAIDARRFTA